MDILKPVASNRIKNIEYERDRLFYVNADQTQDACIYANRIQVAITNESWPWVRKGRKDTRGRKIVVDTGGYIIIGRC